MNTVKKKKSLLLVMILLVCCSLVACNSNPKVKETFTGTIELINEYGGMRVNIEEATGTKLIGLVDIGIPDDTTEEFKVGDKVKVGFDGTTFEIAPVKVQAITIEKIE